MYCCRCNKYKSKIIINDKHFCGRCSNVIAYRGLKIAHGMPKRKNNSHN